MSDWPQSEKFHKPIISSWSLEAVGCQLTSINTTTPVSVSWTSSQALYVPLVLGANFLARKVWWQNGASPSGPIDVGVYTSDGTRLFSSGGTTQSGASASQSVSLGSAYLLTPGSYYLAICFGVNVGAPLISALFSIGQATIAGLAKQASVSLLPATASFATVTSSSVPLFGLSSGTVI